MRARRENGKEKEEIKFKLPEDSIEKNKKLIYSCILKSCHEDKELTSYVYEQVDLFEKTCEKYKNLLFSDRKSGETLEKYRKRTLKYCQEKANAVMNLEE